MKAILWALLTALLWGTAPIFEKAGLHRVEPNVVMLIRALMVVGVVLVALGHSNSLGNIFQVDFRSWIFIVLGGIFSAILGQMTYFYALKNGDASQVIPVICAYPLITVLLSIFLLGEKCTMDKVLGTCLIILGIFYIR